MKRIRTLDIPEIEQIPSFLKLMDDLFVGNNIFLVGSAGTGKTHLAETIAYAHFGRKKNDGKALPYVTINCNQFTSPIDIKGGQTITGYKEGGLIEAWREGKILILDEMPKLDPNTAGLLNDALAKTAEPDAIIFNGLNQPIKKHKDFGCIASGNATGKGLSKNYVGNNKQDVSLLDRFSGSFYHIGYNEPLERKLIYSSVVNICIQIRNVILEYEGKGDTDQETEDVMSLRTMTNLQRNYELEMLRETGIQDKNGFTYPMELGKTLKDGLESYLSIMNPDKAHHVKTEIELESLLNNYKGADEKREFITDYKRRHSII